MAQADRHRKQTERKLTGAIADVMAGQDIMVASPSERATIVYKKLQLMFGDDLTNWDLICFCVEYLGMMVEAFPWLNSNGVMKQLSTLVYTAHYLDKTTLVPSGVRANESLIQHREEDTTTYPTNKLTFRPRSDTEQQGTSEKRSLFPTTSRLFNK